jgi:hypothetical protein
MLHSQGVGHGVVGHRGEGLGHGNDTFGKPAVELGG